MEAGDVRQQSNFDHAIHNFAQSTVFCQIGVNGAVVQQTVVVVVVNKEEV